MTEIVAWLDVHSGTATILAVLLAGLLSGIGWFLGTHVFRGKKEVPFSSATEGAIGKSRLAAILKSKKLRVALLDYPPLMSFVQEGDEAVGRGIYPRMLNHIATDEGLEVEWSIINWSEITDVVEKNKVDVVASIFWTPRRSGHATFCGMMHRIGVTGVVRGDDDRIKSHEDLARDDIRIGTVRGEIGWEYAMDVLHLENKPKRLKVLDQVNIFSAAEMVESGMVDIFLADALSCWLACHRDGEQSPSVRQVFADDALYVCENGFLIPHNDIPLQEWIDKRVRARWRLPELADAEKADLAGLEQVVKRRAP
jgi:ABC-type amino acid transport substrate-binding protein